MRTNVRIPWGARDRTVRIGFPLCGFGIVVLSRRWSAVLFVIRNNQEDSRFFGNRLLGRSQGFFFLKSSFSRTLLITRRSRGSFRRTAWLLWSRFHQAFGVF